MTAFVEGAVAGYGIALPLGAIGVLIMDTAMRRGFRIAAAAGTGAATADLVYALVAMLLGAAVADAVEPIQHALTIVSAVVLLGVAAYLVRNALRARDLRTEPVVEGGGPVATFGRFLGLTILNPATVTYFVALIVGLDRGDASTADKALFVTGAFLASLSCQLTLAGLGAFLHKRLPASMRWIFGVAGAVVIAGFALRLLLRG